MHTHFSRNERAVIASGLRRGRSYGDIAEELGRDKGALWREVRRNRDADGRYRVPAANRKARERRKASKTACRYLETHEAVADTVEALLDPLVSPKTIGHLLNLHHQTIYSWVHRSRPDLKEHLPYRGKKRRRYGKNREEKQGWTKDVRTIHERQEDRLSWEGDTIKGKTKPRLLTHVERNSLYTRADLLPDGTADAVHAVLKAKPLSGTITYDRGSEFALWQMIERDTGATVYFADPHAPHQRGKNENTNGRLRRVFPKRSDLGTIARQDLAAVIDLMNHTPRESLFWRMPAEVYGERCNSG